MKSAYYWVRNRIPSKYIAIPMSLRVHYFIWKNKYQWSKPNFSALLAYDSDFKEVTNTIKLAQRVLSKDENPEFFQNLHKFRYRHLPLKLYYPKGYRVLQNCELFSTNIFVLEWIVRRLQIGKDYTFVDFACGLGNLTGYLRVISSNISVYGIDNFTQLSRATITNFQNLTFSTPVMQTDEFCSLVDVGNVDILTVISLKIEWVIADISLIKPKYVLVESIYVNSGVVRAIEEIGYEVDDANIGIFAFRRTGLSK
jgi:hypothetical protein